MVKLKKSNLNKWIGLIDYKLILFIAYNLAYILYSKGYIRQSINFAIIILLIMINLFEMLRRNDYKLNFKTLVFGKDFLTMMRCMLVFGIISIIIQIANRNIRLDYLSSYFYMIMPLLFAITLVNNTNKQKLMLYFYVFLARFLIDFFISNAGSLTFSAIRMISLNNTQSSIYESSNAHGFFMLMIIFLWFDKRLLAYISGLFCMLCFKRLCFLLTPVILIIWKFFAKKKPNKVLVNSSMAFMFVSPILIDFIVNNSEWINNKFGININRLTTGRLSIISYVMNNIGSFNGFGSISAFLKEHPWGWGNIAATTQMHCDILQLYYEVTLLGVVVFFYCLFKISKKNYASLFLCLYLSAEILTSHFIDVFFVWLLFYLFIAYQRLIEHEMKQ